MSYNLQDGVAVVTGAASGIGRATAVLFAEYGCKQIVIGDINTDALEETRGLVSKANSDAKVEASKLDLRDERSIKEFYDLAVSRFGRIDFAANIAGVCHPTANLDELGAEELEKTYNVNMRGTWLCEKALLTRMVKQDPLKGFSQLRGSIVNITSVCATISVPGLSIYSGSKGGILGITRTDALDYGKHGIRVNAIAPGSTDTPMVDDLLGEDGKKYYQNASPLQRLAQPRDIAQGIVFLSSPNAGYITGVSLQVDGGLWLRTGP